MRNKHSICPAQKVFVLSDSTGNLARHVLTAVLTQFPAESISLRFENFIRDDKRIDNLLIEAREHKAAVCHAMVSDRLKQRIKTRCSAARLRCFDLTGGLVEFLEKATGVTPTGNIEGLHRLDEAYRQRIGAMEFTLSHDDGLGLDTLCEADVVLVGVSRTSKTPTSILLAQQGYRAANVSLARGVEPPAQLFALPSRKVVGLTINPDQLAIIRAHRQAAWGMSQTDYGSPRSVANEVAWCRSIFRERGWPVLDVTDQAVEETAAKVIGLVGPVGRQESSMAEVLPN
jgi:[pyruvate, water dikinase]-phosphate phosphotransferase / [pyruvate, water dikinase] kinase